MNRSDARACVCAMWSYYVRAKDYGGAASIELFDSLVGGSGSASELLVDYVERHRVAGEENRLYASLANKVLLVDEEAHQNADAARSFMDSHLDMLILPDGTGGAGSSGGPVHALERREELLSARVNEFFDLMMAWDYESFAPVELK